MVAGKPGADTSAEDDYMFARSFRDSARLHLQHWIWKEHLGYILHPAIPRTAPDLRVADVGTGNGCWLLDLAQEVPVTWVLEGFDISAKDYPLKENIPDNVGLEVLDAFADTPQHLVARYDIVHIRAFAAVVKHGDPGPLLRNLIKMLKPGGYLQWDEFDPGNFRSFSPSPSIEKTYSDSMISLWQRLARKLDILLSWMSPGVMAAIFEKHHLSVVNDVAHDRSSHPNQMKLLLRKVCTENCAMAVEDTCRVLIGRGGPGASVATVQEFRDILHKTAEEMQQGVKLWWDFQVVVGRKSLE